MSATNKPSRPVFGFLAIGVAIAWASACTTVPTQLRVSVSTLDLGLPAIHQFRVEVTGGSGGTMTRDLPSTPAATPIAFPTQFVAVLPDSGRFTLVVRGLDVNKVEVARGEQADVNAVVETVVDVSVVLIRSSSPPDMAMLDLAPPADLTVVPDLVPPPDMAMPDLVPPPDMAMPDLAPPPDLTTVPDLTDAPDLKTPDLTMPAVLSISDGPTYDFGAQPVGSQTQKTFTVTNIGGRTAKLGSITTGSLGLVVPFSLTGGTCQTGASLAPTAICVLVVAFAPTASGPASGGIGLGYDDGVMGPQVASRALAGTARLSVWTRQLGTASTDLALGIAKDITGNVYVTGYTGGSLDGNQSAGTTDLFLVKYDGAGNKVWTRQLGTGSIDAAFDVATDGSGNIYVTGWSYGALDGNQNAGGNDIILIKYNSTGNKLWTRQLGTTMDDRGYSVATDGAGNIYVTGDTGSGLDGNQNAGAADLFLVSYDSAGNKRWTRQLGSAMMEYAKGVATDNTGNIYVTGYTGGSLDGNQNAGGDDLFLVSYDGAGNKRWTRQMGTASAETAYGVAIDGSGNIYVTGSTSGGLDGNQSAGQFDLFLAKYGSAGNKIWTRQFGTGADDIAKGVAIDTVENIYVTGYSGGDLDGNQNAGSPDLFLVKYGSTGNKIWTRQLGTPTTDHANGVTTDDYGNVYVTGDTNGGLDGNQNAGTDDFFLVKFLTAP